ncbi:hypothetical protein BXZ70DRAFT_1009649 [Cristinia sonorae]|uniref:Uncharacterized protein n=1 Tax=Cristinia sonorae TaxID=1940300 RepID=A0A8K0UL76_9AGAR|nr:hypothetical protein BXZ70DRAFT_1009649 [Cristinia sonorae]
MSVQLEITAPTTRFGRQGADGVRLLSTINWNHVVQFEAENVTKWILFLHHHEHEEAIYLLRAVVAALVAHIDNRHAQSQAFSILSVYAQANLPKVLMGIFCDPGVLPVSNNGSFKASIAYGQTLLTALRVVLQSSQPSTSDDAGVLQCRQQLVSCSESFFQAMWNRRHLIVTVQAVPDRTVQLPDDYATGSAAIQAEITASMGLMAELNRDIR